MSADECWLLGRCRLDARRPPTDRSFSAPLLHRRFRSDPRQSAVFSCRVNALGAGLGIFHSLSKLASPYTPSGRRSLRRRYFVGADLSTAAESIFGPAGRFFRAAVSVVFRCTKTSGTMRLARCAIGIAARIEGHPKVRRVVSGPGPPATGSRPMCRIWRVVPAPGPPVSARRCRRAAAPLAQGPADDGAAVGERSGRAGGRSSGPRKDSKKA